MPRGSSPLLPPPVPSSSPKAAKLLPAFIVGLEGRKRGRKEERRPTFVFPSFRPRRSPTPFSFPPFPSSLSSADVLLRIQENDNKEGRLSPRRGT